MAIGSGAFLCYDDEPAIKAQKYKGTIIKYKIGYDDRPTKHGINGGRIAKLELKQDGAIIALYDKKWTIKPFDTKAQHALKILLNNYN